MAGRGGFFFCSLMSKRRNSLLDNEALIAAPILAWAADHPGSIILESTKRDRSDFRSYVFSQPSTVITAHSHAEVEHCLAEIARAAAEGSYVAGYLSYETGEAFENIGSPLRPSARPLLWFGVYQNPLIIDHRTGRSVGGLRTPYSSRASVQRKTETPSRTLALTPTVGFEDYGVGFDRVQALLESGDSYQVNLTFKLKGSFNGSPAELYDRMRHNQRVKYSAFLNLGTHAIISCSPELFFRSDGRSIILRPMKGTASRGRTLAEDRQRKEWLRASAKNHAENMMIVDLLRNDAGRIAQPGSVEVRGLFDIEEYETVYQATSTIRAKLRSGITIGEMIRCLFPSGSVTGAPKIRTMQIIRELEREQREVYTGSIGFLGPRRKAVFSVAIRTAVVEEGNVEFGVGSGVVHDSVAREEYDECLAKARFLERRRESFDLLETILWDPQEGIRHLRLHLKRLRDSAEYFGFAYEGPKIRSALERLMRALKKKRRVASRIRLLLGRDGTIRMESKPLHPLRGTPRIGFSHTRVDSGDCLLFHKTTSREIYENELNRAQEAVFFDVVFRNEKGEITEGARSNIVVRFGDQYFTPPVEAGLLAGTYRSWLLTGTVIPLKEETLFPDDCLSADEVFICNALRGLVKVTLDSNKEML